MLPKPSKNTFFVGLLGGAADAVPGISGGTVYYVLGVYDDVLTSFASFGKGLQKCVRERSLKPLFNDCAWQYLCVLGLGVITAFLSLARCILLCLDTPFIRPLFFSIFFGLVIGSSAICMKAVTTWKRTQIFALTAGMVLGLFLMNGAPLEKESSFSVNVHSIDLPRASNVKDNRLCRVPASAIAVLCAQGVLHDEDEIYNEKSFENTKIHDVVSDTRSFLRFDLIFAGVMAVSAMLLPGISGSYLLQVLGYYGPVLGAVLDTASGIMHRQVPFYSLTIVLNIALGIACGAVLFAKTILWLFSRFSTQTSAFLSGCMLGSMWCVWPYQKVALEVDPYHIFQGVHLVSAGQYIPSLGELSSTWYIFPLVALAACFVVVIERLAQEECRR